MRTAVLYNGINSGKIWRKEKAIYIYIYNYRIETWWCLFDQLLLTQVKTHNFPALLCPSSVWSDKRYICRIFYSENYSGISNRATNPFKTASKWTAPLGRNKDLESYIHKIEKELNVLVHDLNTSTAKLYDNRSSNQRKKSSQIFWPTKSLPCTSVDKQKYQLCLTYLT